MLLLWTVLGAAMLLLGCVRTRKQQEFRNTYLPYIEDGKEAVLQGTVCRKEAKSKEYHIYLKNVILQIGNQRYQTNQVLVHLSTDEYSIGTTLLVNGTLQRFKPALNDGGYDEERYYHGRKTDYGLWAKTVIGSYGKPSYVEEALYQFRNKLIQSLETNTDEKTAGTLAVMTLGEKSLLDAEVKELYQRLGISHILVISGLHISMLGNGLFGLLKRAGRSIAFSTVMAELFLITYGMMTGNSASALRAILMFSLGMLGKCLGRTYDRATGLAVAVLFLLWQNPFLITDAGFQFSVMAVMGVIAAGKKAKTWKVNGMIQLFTLPLVAFYYYEIPVYAMLVNLLVLPLVTPLVALGFVGSIVGLGLQNLAEGILYIPYILLVVIEKVGDVIGGLPYAMLTVGCPKLWRIYVYFGLLYVFCIRCRKCQEKQGGEVVKKKNVKTEDMKRKRRECMVNPAWICMLFLLLTISEGHATRIDFLDVGQGDGICIQTKDGVNLFVDGGSSDVKGVGIYRIEPYLKYHGIGEIDYWFVSHCDADHINGLIELLEMGYKVEHLVFAKYAVENENSQRLREVAEKNGSIIYEMDQGDVVQTESAKLTCIFPAKESVPEDMNGASLVLLYEEDEFQGIFTGDIGSQQELAILEEADRWNLRDAEVYKAAHHGSDYSNEERWLSYISPQISIVSCSKTNQYGHPGKKAVANMKEVGSRIYHTGIVGQVGVVVGEDGITEVKLNRYLREEQFCVRMAL